MAITTNREYISAVLAGTNVSDSDIDLILIKASLDGSDAVDTEACDLAVYNRLSVVLKASMYNVSEGGYSVSWNIEAIKMYYKTLCAELGKPNVLIPVIRNRSNSW